MFNKKRAQAEIITTVLIILLVLAAIVIVWQVVKSTVEGGGEQVTLQSGCMGVSLSLSNTSSSAYIVQRDASGGNFDSADVVVVKDGSRVAPPIYTLAAGNTLHLPLGTGQITFALPYPTRSVEVAIIGKTGTEEVTCPSTAKLAW